MGIWNIAYCQYLVKIVTINIRLLWLQMLLLELCDALIMAQSASPAGG